MAEVDAGWREGEWEAERVAVVSGSVLASNYRHSCVVLQRGVVVQCGGIHESPASRPGCVQWASNKQARRWPRANGDVQAGDARQWNARTRMGWVYCLCSVLCVVCCVLCVVCCVLCIVYCVLCLVYCVLYLCLVLVRQAVSARMGNQRGGGAAVAMVPDGAPMADWEPGDDGREWQWTAWTDGGREKRRGGRRRREKGSETRRMQDGDGGAEGAALLACYRRPLRWTVARRDGILGRRPRPR